MNGKVLLEKLAAENRVSHDLMLQRIQIGDTLRRDNKDAVVTEKKFDVKDFDYVIRILVQGETLESEQKISYEEMLSLAQVGDTLVLNSTTYSVKQKTFVKSGDKYYGELEVVTQP